MRLHLALLAGVLGLFSLAGVCRAGQQNVPSPLRLLPADTEFFIQIREPHKLADVATKMEVLARAQKLAFVKNQLDTTNVRRALQLLAHVEKRMGDKWPALLEKLAKGGIALGSKYGDKAPALLVIQSDDEKTTKQFAGLAAEFIESELARQESKEKLETTEEQDHERYQVGTDFFAARFGAALIVSNNKDARDKAIALCRGEQKKSLATHPEVIDAAKLLPPNPLADAWFDLSKSKQSEGAKGVFDTPRNDPTLTVLFGGYLDVIGRSPYLAVALTQDKDALSLTIRAPRGRDGMGPDRSLHVGEKDDPGLLPLLAPKGTLYSSSYYLDVAKTWQDRDKLFPQKSAEEFTKANRQSKYFTLGLSSYSALLESAGAHHRVVVTNPGKSGYKRSPKTAVQSFAFVAELRKPERFDWTMSLALRTLGTALSFQYDLIRDERRHNGVKVVGWRFDETKELEGDENDQRFGYSPCYARVGDSFVFCSTIELCHNLIDELKAEKQKKTLERVKGPSAIERFHANGLAQLLEGMEDQLITQAILDQAIEPSEAKQQVRDLIDFVKSLDDVTSQLVYEDKYTHYTFRFGK